jgi:hypothetical protein
MAAAEGFAMTHSFKIKTGLTTNDCSVEMDGIRLEGVCKVSFELSANDLTIVKLEIMGEILVEGEFQEMAILQVAQLKRG